LQILIFENSHNVMACCLLEPYTLAHGGLQNMFTGWIWFIMIDPKALRRRDP